jgi:hypothetical protein
MTSHEISRLCVPRACAAEHRARALRCRKQQAELLDEGARETVLEHLNEIETVPGELMLACEVLAMAGSLISLPVERHDR